MDEWEDGNFRNSLGIAKGKPKAIEMKEGVIKIGNSYISLTDINTAGGVVPYLEMGGPEHGDKRYSLISGDLYVKTSFNDPKRHSRIVFSEYDDNELKGGSTVGLKRISGQPFLVLEGGSNVDLNPSDRINRMLLIDYILFIIRESTGKLY